MKLFLDVKILQKAMHILRGNNTYKLGIEMSICIMGSEVECGAVKISFLTVVNSSSFWYNVRSKFLAFILLF